MQGTTTVGQTPDTIAEAVRRVVAQAPKLTPAQRQKLAHVLGGAK